MKATPTLPFSSLLLAVAICLAYGCGGRFSRERAQRDIAAHVLEKDYRCSIGDDSIYQKPEFRSLAGRHLCVISVEIQTVAITSDTTREVVYNVRRRYDPTVIQEWISSYDKLMARLALLPVSVGKSQSSISDDVCYAYDFSVIDPTDGQKFSIDINDCRRFMADHRQLDREEVTPQLADEVARLMFPGSSTDFLFFSRDGIREQLKRLLSRTEPVEEDRGLADFQLFDDGWRPINFDEALAR
jgi:hypothetical protein